MKLVLFIIAATLIMLPGITSAGGFSLLGGDNTQSVNRWPYSFGDRYIYDNTGSSWNYDSAHKYREFRYHRSNRHRKYWQPRFEYNDKSLVNENIQDLDEHLSKHRSHYNKPFHPLSPLHYDPAYR